jgi:hypothetical protein
MRRGVRRAALLTVAAFAAVPESVAIADAPSTTLLWYRSAEGCPDGRQFLALLQSRGVEARLAEVGDRIDFVVTLGNGSAGGSGLLERQSATGTVAVRKLDGGTCDQVAEGIALTLSLANTPIPHTEVRAVEPAPIEKRVGAPERGTENEIVRDALRPAASHVAGRVNTAERRWAIGVAGDVVSGLAPDPMPGAALFLSFAPGHRSFPRGASLRLSGFVNARAATSPDGRYDALLVGGRVDACPISIGATPIHASPCASVDLGALRTNGGGPDRQTDTGFWAALRAGVRFDLQIAQRVALEAQAAAVFPLIRYDVVAAGPSTSTLYRTAAAGLDMGLGVSFRVP